MGPACHDEGLVLCGALANAGDDGDSLVADELEGTQDLQLLDVLREVTGGHALVNVLVASQGVELFDACLDVVARDALAVSDGRKVDVLDDGLVGRDGLCRDVDAEVLLGLHDGDPQLTLEDDLVLRRPDLGHLGGCIACGQYVGNVLFLSHAVYYRTPSVPMPPTLALGRATASGPSARTQSPPQ